jgi:KDO2-lipid IV(A) lauroyltransferase
MLHSFTTLLTKFEHLVFLCISLPFALVPLFIWLPIIKTLRFFAFDLFGMRKKVVFKNLGIAFPEWTEAQKRKCARKSFDLFLLNMVEFLRSGFIEIWPRAVIENIDLAQKTQTNARQAGKTTLGIVFHMSNWEALAPVLARYGFASTTVSKSAGRPFADRFLVWIRERNGMGTMLITGAKGSVYRKMLVAMEQGLIIGFPMDQHRFGSPYVDFFGTPATTNASFAAIQHKQKLPVMLAYPVRTGLNRGKVVFEEFSIPAGGKDSTATLLAVNHAIETVIQKHPEQYFWLHNRWK